jgi:ATP-dependent Clp protease ATP-binding subunit ClpX
MQHDLLPTPSAMIAHLDRFVHGQTQAKRCIATAVYNHFLGIGWRDERLAEGAPPSLAGSDLGKQHVLLMGPTGSGKTYMVRLLAEYLGLPYCYYRANALSKTGYVGMSVEQLIGAVYIRAGGEVATAERAIILLDEVDKIRSQESQDIDVSGGAVQEMLLPVLDGCVISAFGDKSDSGRPSVDIDTSSMLFVCSGAFVDLAEVVRGRVGGSGAIGFGGRGDASSRLSNDELLAQATNDDLVRYGFIPEFVGRFATVAAASELSDDDLVAILTRSEDSVLAKQARLCSLHGIELSVTTDAARRIAARARAAGTGARGLARILGGCLDDVSYRLPELADSGVTRITVTAGVVEGQGRPLLERCSTGGRSCKKTAADRLRESVIRRPTSSISELSAPSAGISDTRGWSQEQVERAIDASKRQVAYEETSGGARAWWDSFERDNAQRPALVLRVLEELRGHTATVHEFYSACMGSGCAGIQANIHYMLYLRLKREDEERKRQREGGASPDGPEPSAWN